MAQVTIPDRVSPRSPALPGAIRLVLGRLDRRLRTAAALQGLGEVAGLAALGAVVGMGADFAWVLPAGVRWGIWGAWLAASGLMLALRVVGPLVRRTNLLDLAAVVERSEPGLGERLTAAVGLLGEAGHANGSPALVAALADDASARAGAVDPARVVALRAAARRLALGGGVLALVVAPGLVRPDPFGTLARRFLAPWADLDRVGRWALTVAPGDGVAVLGGDLRVSARIRPRFGMLPPPDEAWLEWREEGGGPGETRRVAMSPVETPDPSSSSSSSSAERAFAVILPRLAGSLRYRVVSGSAVSRSYRVRAVEPAAVARVEAWVEPPAYTRTAPGPAPDPARIEAWEGSRVVLEIVASRPVRAVEVGWPATAQGVAAALGTGRRTARAFLVATATGPYTVSLRDEYGLAGAVEAPRRLVVRPDAPPVLAVEGPDAPVESGPADTLHVAVAARDDIAIAAVELHYALRRGGSGESGSETEHVAVPVNGLGTSTARGAVELALGPLAARPGDILTYRVRVADNRPAPRGPNVVWSPGRTLAIAAQAEPLRARRDRADREALQAKLDALKAAAAENRKETEQLRYAADAVLRGNGQWDRPHQQALAQRESQARAVADRLQLLARDLAATARFDALARPARQIAEVEAESGRALLDQMRVESDPARRLDGLRQADARLAAVSGRLDELQRRFDALARRDADLQRLRDLAGREEALAGRAAEAEDEDAADRARLDRLQAEQAAVQKDLDGLLKQSPELRSDVLEAQAGEAEALARRARDLADRQREEARRSTDLARSAGVLKELADAQRTLEDDARRLALEVDEPLAESGRGRLNIDPLRQAAEPLERGDLDQARQRLDGAEAELRRLARDLEEVPGDARALALRLARRQDALNAQVAEALRQARARRVEPSDEEAKELAARLGPLAARQEAIARLAEALQPPRDAAAEAARRFPADAAGAAARSTARAAEALRAARTREIETGQADARRDLQRLAAALVSPRRRQGPDPGPRPRPLADVPADPELAVGPGQAEAAGKLAGRQRQIRERAQAILGKHAQPQQALRRETSALGRELADLGERSRPLSGRSQGPARQAAQLLGDQAPRAMDQGSEHLAQGRAAAAREAQRHAAELVERGAQQAEDLAASLRGDHPAADPPRAGASPTPGSLDAAREAMRQAARDLDQARDPARGAQASQAATRAMRQAAHDLRAAAEARQGPRQERQGQGQGAEQADSSEPSARPGPGEPAPGSQPGRTRDPRGTRAGAGTPDLAAIQALVRSKTGRAWGELPGHLRSEILQMSQGRYRDDYARLIQLYYQEIAAGAGSSDPPRP